jgi:hypothetical protein
MAIFMDIEFVSLVEAEEPDVFAVTFDVIYGGETWCRSEVLIDRGASSGIGFDQAVAAAVARDALLEKVAVETAPVALRLRITNDGVEVLGRKSFRQGG